MKYKTRIWVSRGIAISLLIFGFVAIQIASFLVLKSAIFDVLDKVSASHKELLLWSFGILLGCEYGLICIFMGLYRQSVDTLIAAMGPLELVTLHSRIGAAINAHGIDIDEMEMESSKPNRS